MVNENKVWFISQFQGARGCCLRRAIRDSLERAFLFDTGLSLNEVPEAATTCLLNFSLSDTHHLLTPASLYQDEKVNNILPSKKSVVFILI
jgi:hypothetical protein